MRACVRTNVLANRKKGCSAVTFSTINPSPSLIKMGVFSPLLFFLPFFMKAGAAKRSYPADTYP